MSGNTFIWTGDANNGAFGDANNWSDTTSSTAGPPEVDDTAKVETTGTISGSSDVYALVLDGDGGLLTSTVQINAVTLQLEGSLALSGGTFNSVSGTAKETGTSTVTMNDGGGLYIDGGGSPAKAFDIAPDSSDRSTFNLAGIGTLVGVGLGNVVIGDSGIGAMTVSSGAQLVTNQYTNPNSGSVILGDQAGSQGTLTVTGQSSELQANGELVVGEAGKGVVSILAGAKASLIGSYLELAVGDTAGSTGSVLVSGAGSQLSTSYGSLAVIGGDGATGTLTIADAGVVELSSLAVGAGDGNGATGKLLVEGAGSTLELRGELQLGEFGTGSLQITSGAHVLLDSNLPTDELGADPGDKGSISVAGVGSTFDGGIQPLYVGFGGSGSVTISNGGEISTSTRSGPSVFVGYSSSSSGSVTLNGGVWSSGGEFDVGYGGTGTLLVKAGALETTSLNGAPGFVVGNKAESVGSATITGTASLLQSSGEFVIGNAGSGKLTISAGAVVNNGLPPGGSGESAVIGEASGGSGTVVVTGTNSLWGIGSNLIIGDAGTGLLAIGVGGTVSAASLQMGVSGMGAINVTGAGAELSIRGNATFGGTAKATVAIGSGGLVAVGGTAEIKDSGMTLSGGELSVTKTLTVDAAQLIKGYGTVAASGIINAATVQSNGGTLSFIGGITGTGKFQILAGSTLSLGSSVAAGQEAIFESATSKLVLGTPASFAGTLDAFVKGDTIDLSSVIASSLTYSGQTLTVHESGGAALALKFAGTYTQSSFGMTSDGHSGTFITHT